MLNSNSIPTRLGKLRSCSELDSPHFCGDSVTASAHRIVLNVLSFNYYLLVAYHVTSPGLDPGSPIANKTKALVEFTFWAKEGRGNTRQQINL